MQINIKVYLHWVRKKREEKKIFDLTFLFSKELQKILFLINIATMDEKEGYDH
jgi:hypothetical protein